MLDTTLPLNPSLVLLTDRARQRNYTYEECTLIAAAARTKSLGCDVLSVIQEHESVLVDAALRRGVPALGPEEVETLRAAMTLCLRQSGLAMAADEVDELCRALVSLQPIFWGEPGLRGDAVHRAFEALRTETRARIPGYTGRRFDQYIKACCRYLTLCAEVGACAPAAIEESAQALFDRMPELSRKYPAAREKAVADQLQFVLYAVHSTLPDGDQRMLAMGRVVYEFARRAKFEPSMMLQSITLLRKSMHKALPKGRCHEYLQRERQVLEYVYALCEVATKRETILQAAKAPVAASPTNGSDAPAADGLAVYAGRVLDLAILGSVPGSRDALIFGAEEIALEWARMVPDTVAATAMLQALLHEAERSLSSLAYMQLQHPLHRLVHFLSQALNLAHHRGVMLDGVVSALEEKYPEFYTRHLGGRSYTRRDHEQLIYNTALSLLPGAEYTTVGRFQAFGEFLADYGFKKELMFDFFEMLEQAFVGTYDAQALGYLLPYWARVRRYLEAECTLAATYQKIIDDTLAVVSQKYPAEMKRTPDAAAKCNRDLKTMLQTAMASTLPGGERIIRRGMAHFIESILDSCMPADLLDLTVATLKKNVQAHLEQTYSSWILPILEKMHVAIRATAQLAPHLGEVVDASARGVLARHAQAEAIYPEALRRAGDDFDNALRRCLLALAPGGADWLAEGTWAFGNSLIASGYPPNMLVDGFGELKKQARKHLDRPTASAFDAVMDPFLEAVGVYTELAEHEQGIITATMDAVFKSHPTVLAKYPDCRQKAAEDLSDALRYAVMGTIPGGDWWVRRFARVEMNVCNKSAFDPSFIHDTYAALARVAGEKLSRGARKVILPQLELMRDYMALIAGIAQREQVILEQSVEELVKKHGDGVLRFPNARDKSISDERMVLRSSAMALFPQCQLIQDEVAAVIRAAGRKSHFDPAVMRDAFAILKQSCTQHLSTGPVATLTKKIQACSQVLAP